MGRDEAGGRMRKVWWAAESWVRVPRVRGGGVGRQQKGVSVNSEEGWGSVKVL